MIDVSEVMKLDKLMAAARLGGRIALLLELRAWLDDHIAAAEEALNQLDNSIVEKEEAQ